MGDVRRATTTVRANVRLPLAAGDAGDSRRDKGEERGTVVRSTVTRSIDRWERGSLEPVEFSLSKCSKFTRRLGVARF